LPENLSPKSKRLVLQHPGDFDSQTPHRGSAPGLCWGTFVPKAPYIVPFYKILN